MLCWSNRKSRRIRAISPHLRGNRRHLHLVGPLGFSIEIRQLKRAGLDYWHLLDITTYESLEEFFSGMPALFSISPRKADASIPMCRTPTERIWFSGRRRPGLPEELLRQNLDACVRLPMLDDDAARSLNLSNTVAVGVYETLRQWGFPALRTKGRLA